MVLYLETQHESQGSLTSKAQPLLLTLDERYLLTAAPPDLEHGVAPLDISFIRNKMVNNENTVGSGKC